MSFIIAALFLICGLVGTFRTDWVGTFKSDRDKKLCRRWSVGLLVCGIVLSAFLLYGLYLLSVPEK